MKKVVLKGMVLIIALLVLVGGLGINVEATEHDFEGRTVTIHGYNVGEDAYFSGKEGQSHLSEIEEDFNVDLEFESYDYHEVPDIMREDILSGDAGGIWHLWYNQALELALEGFLKNLEPYETHQNYFMENSLDPELEHFQGDQFIFNTAYADNWSVVDPETDFWGLAVQGIFYNKDMLEENGLTDLNELYENGEWTWETFEETLSDLTQDQDGDGETDQYGLVGTWSNIPYPFIFSNDARTVREIDNRATFTLDESEAIEGFEFLHEIVDSGYVLDNMDWPQELWADQEGAMMMVHLWGFSTVMEDLDFEAGYVPLPRGPEAEEHIAPATELGTAAIPATHEENAQALIDLHTALFKNSEEYVSYDEIEEGIYNGLGRFAQSEEMLDNLFWAQQNVVLEKYSSSLLGIDVNWDIKDPIVTGDESAASLIDSYKDEVQENLDDVFDQ